MNQCSLQKISKVLIFASNDATALQYSWGEHCDKSCNCMNNMQQITGKVFDQIC